MNTNNFFLGKKIHANLIGDGKCLVAVVDKAPGNPNRWVVQTDSGVFRFGVIENFFFTEDGFIISTPRNHREFKTGIEVKINLDFFTGLGIAVKRIEKKFEEFRLETGEKKSSPAKDKSFVRKEKIDNIITLRFDGEYLRVLANGFVELMEPMADAALALAKMGFFRQFKTTGDKMEAKLKLREKELAPVTTSEQNEVIRGLDRKIRAYEEADVQRDLAAKRSVFLNPRG